MRPPVAGRRRELLAMPVGALKPAEIGALARAGARDEEAHIRAALLRRGGGRACRQERGGDNDGTFM